MLRVGRSPSLFGCLNRQEAGEGQAGFSPSSLSRQPGEGYAKCRQAGLPFLQQNVGTRQECLRLLEDLGKGISLQALLWKLHAEFAILGSPSTMDLEKDTREEFELVGPGLLPNHGSKQDR